MIEIKMTVDDVDYEEILETLYPLLEERLYNKIENPLLAGLLSKMKGLPMVTIKAMLKTLPQKTKDELVVLCLNYYKENIVRMLTDTLERHGIPLNIQDMEAVCVEE
ncbi:hypothetical protein B5F29_08920 [Lachnoclostridium sp. An196]|uniref:hypothetical protein n=1 Tax=Lachnoclostridium sp. An196 TaxID=1965583 RepID=UPI000B399E97|nr:hypothetical protein [Lachnoclostridium sp. An196]OUP19443.1 hypothetical protein B5F29_08920 [Lachnoclostridium sp. An196]